MKAPISKFLLFEYLSGRANPLERQLVEDWVRENDNSEIFYQWVLEFESQCPQFMPDEEAAMGTLLLRINSDSSWISEAVKSPVEGFLAAGFQRFRHFLMIAASVMLLLGCAWFFREPIMYKTYETAYGQTTDVYLEDGSRVALNSNSRLRVPRLGFDSDVRNVSLDGEAEFAVSHTADNKRFVVKTSDAFQVEVLGTVFSVFARKRGTRVALKCGSVRIDYSQDNLKREVMMQPGDLATLDKSGNVQLERKRDTKTFAPWKQQRYVFNATPVSEIAAMMEENFGEKVKMADPAIAQRTITGNFKTGDAHELLRTVSEVLDLHIEQNGNTTLLTNN